MDKWEGQEIHGYRIGEILGVGSSGPTYKGIQTSTDESVAIKLLIFAQGLVDPKAKERFQQEVRILVKVGRHPNIIGLRHHGVFNDIPYLVTEFKSGGNLRHLLEINTRGLDTESVLNLFAPIASALDFAHELGIIHRDLKPENIVLNRVSEAEIHPYITDFGVATMKEGTNKTESSTGVGTHQYMAPEVWDADAEKTKQVDIYALGIMLYEALEGHPPFQGTMRELMHMHLEREVPYPHETRKRTNKQVVKVILKALAKNPSKRYQSAGALVEELRIAYETGAQQDREERFRKITIWMTIGIGMATVAATLIAGFIQRASISPISTISNTPSIVHFRTDQAQTSTLTITPTFAATLTNTPTSTFSLTPTFLSSTSFIPVIISSPITIPTQRPSNAPQIVPTNTSIIVPTNTPIIIPSDSPAPICSLGIPGSPKLEIIDYSGTTYNYQFSWIDNANCETGYRITITTDNQDYQILTYGPNTQNILFSVDCNITSSVTVKAYVEAFNTENTSDSDADSLDQQRCH